MRAALESPPRAPEQGPLPKLNVRTVGLHSDEASAERAEAALALHDQETVSYVLLVVRSDSHTLDVHAQVALPLLPTVLDGLASMHAGLR